jgi:aspartyl-tRNA(Asn)/glutamyl-tRNA(Gln) amidotransferase subunit A
MVIKPVFGGLFITPFKKVILHKILFNSSFVKRLETISAQNLSAQEYLTRLARLLELAKSAAGCFDDVDVIVTPTVMVTPHILTEESGPEKFRARNRHIVHNLVPVNYLKLCAVTLPVGLDRLGMPVGLQFIARGSDDERLVAIACAAERVLGSPREILGMPPMCKS